MSNINLLDTILTISLFLDLQENIKKKQENLLRHVTLVGLGDLVKSFNPVSGFLFFSSLPVSFRRAGKVATRFRVCQKPVFRLLAQVHPRKWNRT